MEFTIIGGAPDKQRVPCVVAGVFDKRKLAETAAQLDQASHHYIRRIIKRGDLDGRCGQTLMLHQIPGTAAERILLIGCGPKNELSDNKYREIVAKAVTTLNDAGVTRSRELPRGDSDPGSRPRLEGEATGGNRREHPLPLRSAEKQA